MLKHLKAATHICLHTRNSSYNPHFINPIFRKSDLKKLGETGEAIKLRHVPIKAAKSEETSSEFYDPIFEKFVNYVMKGGNKELARTLMNKTLETVKRIQVTRYNKEQNLTEKAKINLNALDILHKAIENCKPLLQLTPIKRGGATYQVPEPITANRATFMSMNWLIEQGKADSKTARFYEKLARELISASNNQGKVIKRKQDLHRQCEANRAYAHYRWS